MKTITQPLIRRAGIRTYKRNFKKITPRYFQYKSQIRQFSRGRFIRSYKHKKRQNLKAVLKKIPLIN